MQNGCTDRYTLIKEQDFLLRTRLEDENLVTHFIIN